MNLISILTILAIVTLNACSGPTTPATGAEKEGVTLVPVQVQPIAGQTYQEYGEYFGALQAIEHSQLVSYGGGRVTAINATPGDQVKAGTKLCDIDGERFDLIYESAKLSENISKQNYDRAKIHLQSGSSSKLRADQNHLEYLQARTERINAEKTRGGAHCISPIAGTVVGKHLDLHDDLQPGAPTLTIANLDRMKLEVSVPESSIDGYEVGRSALVSLDSKPGREWQGTITSVELAVSEADRSFRVEVTLDNQDHALKPGVTAKAKLLRFDLADQIVIPSEVILTLANKRIVMVAEGETAKAREVTVRSANKSQSLIATGLAIGDRLIVQGQSVAVDGSPLKITNP